MKYLKLASGHRTKVDDDDYTELSTYSWHLSNGYPSRHKNDGSSGKIYLHRVVSKTPEGLHTDHINGNKLDNRKINLRVVTASQNHMNRRKDGRKGLTSNLKGASYHKQSKKWRARIKVGDKQLSLGYFDTAMAAHTAYIEAAKKYYGIYRFVG